MQMVNATFLDLPLLSIKCDFFLTWEKLTISVTLESITAAQDIRHFLKKLSSVSDQQM